MKFAHSFSEELRNNEYPSEWQNAAIRYRQLKKCIKKVMQELDELGLNADTLQRLAEHRSVVDYNGSLTRAPALAPDTRRYSFSSTSTGTSSSSGTDGVSGDSPSETSTPPTSPQLPSSEQQSCIEVADSKADASGGITLKYWFDGTLQAFSPKLVLTVDLQKGIPVNMNLAPEARKALERLVISRKSRGMDGDCKVDCGDEGGTKQAGHADCHTDGINTGNGSDGNISRAAAAQSTTADGPNAEVNGSISESSDIVVDDTLAYNKDVSCGSPPDSLKGECGERKDGQRKIHIPLSADTEFFRLLTSEIAILHVVQSKEEKSISSQVVALGDRVTDVAKPTKLTSNSDLYQWREIFRIYVESGIFFAAKEMDRSQRPVEKAEEKMRWFLGEVKRLKLSAQFKNKQSHALFSHFITLNMSILRLLRFQSINKTAMTKILKKFDKRTALGVREKYPKFIASDPFLSNQVAKAICFTMSERLLNIIPQLDDYLCPICSSISIKPVRLACTHVFCVRCLVKLQRDRKHNCPICRSKVVHKASADNLDISLLNFLKHYFPKEAKIKQLENEKEVTLEQFQRIQARGVGIGVERPGCVIT